jgi:hypothetical protein
MRAIRMNICLAFMLPAALVYGQTQGETPKRTIFDSNNQTPRLVKATAAEAPRPPAASGPHNGGGASSRALDALTSSQEDLNAIRDGNVRRLTTGGCAPDVSARIADLAARLHLNAPANIQSNPQVGSESATLALASDWFKRPGDTSSRTQGKDQKTALLESVLPGAQPAALDAASLKGELDRLLTTCPAVKR